MAIHDFRRLQNGTELKADICIVGSGPASWTLCDELRASGLSILVLESGGALESGIDLYQGNEKELNQTVDTGEPLFNGRRRRLGGTTEVGGWANRTTRFDPIDFEARPWVKYSGWPIDAATIVPYLDRASLQLGVGPASGDPPLLPPAQRWPAIDSGQLSPVTWIFGQAEGGRVVRFARLFRQKHRSELRILVNATVTQVVTNAEGSLAEAVEFQSPEGMRGTVQARAIVLAAGGIENPRLLLCSTRSLSAGLGNQHGLVGRFLMDHPRDLGTALSFDPAQADSLRAIFGTFRLNFGAGPRYVANGFALSAERQRRDELLNCAAWPCEETAPDDPVEAAKRLAQRRGPARENAKLMLHNPGHVLRSAHRRLLSGHALHGKAARIGLIIGSEQQPDPDSRVTLADRVDRFGLPLARTHWKIDELERASQRALAQTVASEFDRLGLPHATLAEWAREGATTRATLVDGCHPTGTTRMAASPLHGVVDADCQVHGVAGLYVAGSSVFPTAGHANPTLMIAAMAARLADHLAGTLTNPLPASTAGAVAAGPGRAVDSSDPDGSDADWTGALVVVTGASGFLGGRLVERLVGEGARVICLLRGPPPAALVRCDVVTRVVDLADGDAVRAATADAAYVMHCAYDWANEDWNRRALAALIAAGRIHHWKRFVHVSSFVVYDLPPSGTLTEETIDTTASHGYARTKLDLETAILAEVPTSGLSATIVQPTLVYGPGSQPWTIDPVNKLKNGTVILPDRGEGICNAVFVDDVVRAMLLAARSPGAVGQRFLISGEPVTWRDFYEGLAQAAGTAGPVYLTRDAIIAKNRPAARLLRGILTPRLLARKVAGVGAMRRAVTKASKLMPERAGSSLRDQLYGPISRLRGQKHLPDAGGLQFLESTARIDSARARARIGYVPRFTLEAGMTLTRGYLLEHMRR